MRNVNPYGLETILTYDEITVMPADISNNIEDLLTPEMVDRIINTGLELVWMFGWCPVAAGGRLQHLDFYFRARGSRWSFCLGKRGSDLLEAENTVFQWKESWGDDFEAGYMPLDIALCKILDCVEKYIERETDIVDEE